MIEEVSLTRLHNVMESLIRCMVDNEDAVNLTVVSKGLVHVSVAPEDFGRVVGREGKNAKALRSLMSAMVAKLQLPTFMLIIEDPNPAKRGERKSLENALPPWPDR